MTTAAKDSHLEDWPRDGLEDDLRPRMAALLARGQRFALATIAQADGGPRGVGSQMVVTPTESWGFVSGGCIEGDVALHARAVLAESKARRLVYGHGSPWADIRLPCGGQLQLLVEPIEADDPAIAAFVAAHAQREAVRYRSDGVRRRCAPPGEDTGGECVVDSLHEPPQRLVVIGSDPIALAIAMLGAQQGWMVDTVWPSGAGGPPLPSIRHWRNTPAVALAQIEPDAFCAIAIATHDRALDEEAILAALPGRAAYIGVLGARRRIADRVASLKSRGVSEADIARLRMPIGLPVGSSSPWEIAISVCAQIIAERRDRPR